MVIIKKMSNQKGKLIQSKRNSTAPLCDTHKRSDSFDNETSGHKGMDNNEVFHSCLVKYSTILQYTGESYN